MGLESRLLKLLQVKRTCSEVNECNSNTRHARLRYAVYFELSRSFLVTCSRSQSLWRPPQILVPRDSQQVVGLCPLAPAEYDAGRFDLEHLAYLLAASDHSRPPSAKLLVRF